MTRACRSTITKPRTAMLSGLCQAVSAVVMLTTVASLLAGGLPLAMPDTQASAAFTAERQIIHLLNRIGYGPRPGDIERLNRIGLDKYIDEQLHPETTADMATEARLRGLESLRMTIAELSEKHPERGKVARQLGLRPPPGVMQEANSAESSMSHNEPQAGNSDARRVQQDERQQILAYYADQGLNPPQKILQELQAQKLIRAVYSQHQLLEAMTDFWFNHFNVFWGKGDNKWLTTDFEMQAIRPYAMGKFQDLLLATAKSPAMLVYLDNFLSSSPDAKRPDRTGQNELFSRREQGFASFRGLSSGQPEDPLGRTSGLRREMMDAAQPRQMVAKDPPKRQAGINENYARELMELHTMGVDGGYTQKDVQEVARCFTSWTIERPRRVCT
jgi:uncharacterized protein (DUF1800 family)